MLNDYRDVISFWLFTIFLNLYIIYHFVVRNKIFSPMTERKKMAIWKSMLYTVPFLLFFIFSGWHQPWMPQESLSNLKMEEGILRITHYSKGNHAYLEGGSTNVIELVCPYSLRKLSGYENENATIWLRGKYIYQMKINDEMIFSISEANSGLFKYNLNGVFLDLFVFGGVVLWFTFLYVSIEG